MKRMIIVFLLLTLLITSGCSNTDNKRLGYYKKIGYKSSTNNKFIKCGDTILPPNYCDIYGGNPFNTKKYCAVRKTNNLQLKKRNINEFSCYEIDVTIKK